MKAIWAFYVIRADFSVSRARRKAGLTESVGSDEEALELANRVHQHLASSEVLRVEARTVKILEPPKHELRERKRFVLRQRNPCGWQMEASDLAHPCAHPKLEHAISYAAFRGRGHCCEIRVVGLSNELRQVILADQSSGKGCCVVLPEV